MKHQQSQTVVSERVEALVKRARRVYAELEANTTDEPDVIASGISKSATRADAVQHIQKSPAQKTAKARKAWEAQNREWVARPQNELTAKCIRKSASNERTLTAGNGF